MPKKELITSFASIIIPCRNEERYIEKCLISLINSTYPKESFEVLVVDGMSGDDTRRIIENYHTIYHFIHLIDNPERTTPHALNRGIRYAKGDYVIILSAHADYPPNYCEKLVTEAIRLDADCTGAVLQTKTFIQNNTTNAIINVLSDRFGVGSHFRSGVDAITEVDTVAFGCYSKKTFEQYGLFDERLIRNQDIEFNKRLIRGGEKIYLLPDITCTYYARETYTELAKNNYQNGYWNILTAYYTGTLHSLSLRHFIPLAFVVSIILPILISPICPQILWLPFTIFIIYILIIAKRSWDIKHKTTWLCQIWAFITLHFSYGFGSIGGIIALTKKILFRDSK